MNGEHEGDDEGSDFGALAGTPIRVSDWLGRPIILSLPGTAATIWLLYIAFEHGLTPIGWIMVLCGLTVVVVSARLAIYGYRAFTRITAVDTYQWLRAQLVTYSVVAGCFLLAGAAGGVNVFVFGGILGGVGVFRWSAAIPATVDPEARIARTGHRASLFLALLLFVTSIATALIGFLLPIPTSISSQYISGAFAYVVLAAIGIIYLWRNRVRDRPARDREAPGEG